MSFKSVLAFFSKKEKRHDKNLRDEELKIEEVGEEMESEDKSEETKNDKAFVRTTLRQSIKRAKEWRKSQRKAVNRRKKENIHNSKLLTGGTADGNCSEDIEDYYEDSEIDAVVVTDSAVASKHKPHNDNPPGSSKLPKGKHTNVKRPAMSIRSAGFFSQSVTSKKAESCKKAESGIPVYSNKASALRKEAAQKKLGSGGSTGNTEQLAPAPSIARVKKQRASFRTKKGIARKPMTVRKEIKPTENKAFRLRAKKVQEVTQEEVRARSDSNPVRDRSGSIPSTNKPAESKLKPDRYVSTGVKTPAPKSAPNNSDTSDPLLKPRFIPRSRTSESIASSKTAASPVPRSSTSSSLKSYTPSPLKSRTTGDSTKSDQSSSAPSKVGLGKTSNEPAPKVQTPKAQAPQKPSRTRVPGSNTPNSPRSLPNPRVLNLHGDRHSEHTPSPKYTAKSQKCYSPKPKPESCFSPTAKLSALDSKQPEHTVFNFIPIQTPSEPEKPPKPKIDDVPRKRRIRHPATNTITISNIFDGGAGDLLPSNNRTYTAVNAEENHTFTVHVNTPPSPVDKIGALKSRNNKPSNRSDVPINKSRQFSTESKSRSPKTLSLTPQSGVSCSSKNSTSPSGKTYSAIPKPVQRTSQFESERRGSLDSCKRSKKGIKSVRPVLTHSPSYNSENSDLENSGSFGSYKSYENDPIFDDDILDSPVLAESPRFRSHPQVFENRLNISIDDLEKQKQYLRSTPSKTGTIRVKNVKTRRSWLKTDDDIFFDQIEKEKSKSIDEELLRLEDLTSGHEDVVQTLASRTRVLKKVISLQRTRSYEKSARFIVSLSFPRTCQDEEFKSMKRSFQCNTDDTALFENCLGILLNERSNVTLPVLATLAPQLRYTFEILGTKTLRSNVEDMVKYLTTNFGHKITCRNATPGINYRLRDHAEICNTELSKIKQHLETLLTPDSEHIPELLALKKHLEIFDGS